MEEVKQNDKGIGELVSIQTLIDGNYRFKVPDYQRGYKWGILEIDNLLNDILEFETTIGKKEPFYCLQPVVVRSMEGNNHYELIDGQQRLTTIYIILKALGNEENFELSYETRKTSKEFLQNIENLNKYIPHDLNLSQVETLQNKDEKIKSLNGAWEDYIDNNKIDNVDNYHFFCAYCFIKSWKETYSKEEINDFHKALTKFTKVIWYNPENRLGSDVSGKDVFIDFNRGKIALDQAELIKALFVIRFKKDEIKEIRKIKIQQFSNQWDEIENRLQDDDFWYFISNDDSEKKKYNRIDLLFDIVQGKTAKENDPLYSFNSLLKTYKQIEKGENLRNNKLKWNEEWQKVIDLFFLLQEWYDNRQIYHLIGYIVFFGIKSISNIEKTYQETKGKNQFEEELKQFISKDLFKKNKNEESDYFNEIKELDYEESAKDRKKIEKILLLHNIVTYQKTDELYRVPFAKIKNTQDSSGWSLEHIHAQNADELKDINDIKEWLKDQEKLSNDFREDKEKDFRDKFKALRKELKESEKINGAIKEKAKNLDEETSELLQKDAISNLCLLDKKTNSSLGKKYFKEKRERILEIDQKTTSEYIEDNPGVFEKPYIPMATRNVFTKYYTRTGNDEDSRIQFAYWGKQDRDDYEEDILTSLQQYLNLEKNENE